MTLRVPITAVSIRTALADTVAALRTALADGASAVADVRGFAASPGALAAQIGTEGETIEDDPGMRILGPHGRLLERVAHDAHTDAGLVTIPRERVGLHIATGMVDSAAGDLEPVARTSRGADGAFDQARFFRSAYRSIHPLWPLSMLANVAVGQIATDLDVRGDNIVLASDAAAGVRAILEGARAVAGDVVDATLCGGVAERVCPASLARRRHAGLGNVPPGEGAGVLALGGPGTPIGWLLGGATAFDANAEVAAGAARDRALARAGMDARELDDHVRVCGGDSPPDGSPFERGLGDLGPAAPAIGVALSLGQSGTRVLVTAVSPEGGAGALLVEAV